MWPNYRKADGARPRILNRGSIDPGVGNWFGGGGKNILRFYHDLWPSKGHCMDIQCISGITFTEEGDD